MIFAEPTSLVVAERASWLDWHSNEWKVCDSFHCHCRAARDEEDSPFWIKTAQHQHFEKPHQESSHWGCQSCGSHVNSQLPICIHTFCINNHSVLIIILYLAFLPLHYQTTLQSYSQFLTLLPILYHPRLLLGTSQRKEEVLHMVVKQCQRSKKLSPFYPLPVLSHFLHLFDLHSKTKLVFVLFFL